MSEITLDQAKDLIKKQCADWPKEQLVAVIQEWVEILPGLRLEQWVSQNIRDKDGNSPTVVGHG